MQNRYQEERRLEIDSPDVRTEIEYLLTDKWKGDEENFFKAYKREIAEMEEEE